MNGPRGDGSSADRRFLQEMADHHRGLVIMGQQMAGQGGEVRADAEMLAKKQQAELEHLLGKLHSDFDTDYTPRVDPLSQEMLRKLGESSEAEHDAEFRRMVIKHHEEGIRMGDRYLPELSKPELKVMTQRMRAEQVAEIEEQNQKIELGM